MAAAGSGLALFGHGGMDAEQSQAFAKKMLMQTARAGVKAFNSRPRRLSAAVEHLESTLRFMDYLQDYKLLDDPSRVRRAHKLVDRLFGKAESLPADKLRKEAWRIGVEQRAFYVLGAHMARTIDENLGRDALADTIARGPRSFVSTYNNVVEEQQRVVEFPAPDQPSWAHQLRLSAAQRDYGTLRQLLETVAQPEPGDVFAAEEPFICAGRLLLRQERYDLAVQVFERTTRLFPNIAAGHYFLGEACLKLGDTDRAVASYRRTLELDPGHLYAPARLKALEKAASAEPE